MLVDVVAASIVISIINIILFGLGWVQMSSAIAHFFPQFYIKFIKIANLILETSFIMCSIVIMLFPAERAPLALYIGYWMVWGWFAWLWIGSKRKGVLLFENRIFKKSWVNTVLLNTLFIPFAFGTLALSVVAVTVMFAM